MTRGPTGATRGSMKRVIRSLAALFVVACGGKTLQSDISGTTPPSSTDSTMPSAGDPNDAGAPGASSDVGIPDPPTSLIDGGLPIDGGALPIDGGTLPVDPDASTGDAGAPVDRRLFPAEDLRSWSYDGYQTQNGLTTRVLYSYMILGIITELGHDVYVVTSSFNGKQASNHTWITSDDDVQQRYGFDPTWYPILKGPAVDGAAWTYNYNGTRTSTWHAVPSITVPAGMFTDCWRIATMIPASMRAGDVNDMVMCRGVGVVKVSQRIWNGYVLDYALVAKNF